MKIDVNKHMEWHCKQTADFVLTVRYWGLIRLAAGVTAAGVAAKAGVVDKLQRLF